MSGMDIIECWKLTLDEQRGKDYAHALRRCCANLAAKCKVLPEKCEYCEYVEENMENMQQEIVGISCC